MNDIPREKLKELVRRFGTSLPDDRQRCLGMLKDVCGEYRKEIAGLMAALDEGIPSDLQKTGIPIEIIRGQSIVKLEENRGLAKHVAVWSVDTWALALGVIDESQLKPTKTPEVVITQREAPKTNTLPSVAQPKPISVRTQAPQNVPPTAPGAGEQTKIDLGRGITLELVTIPAGSFQMGSNRRADADEQPIHSVTVKAFRMGKYAVTQAQYKAIMSVNPSFFKGDNLPVENVCWNNAKSFCDKLSKMIGQEVRLSTEAEWEYACRSGTTTHYAFGNTITPAQVNYDGNYPFGNPQKGEYRQKTLPVGSFSPNAWGLYQMHGNVWEWCEDVWHKNYTGAPIDGTAWIQGGDQSRKLLRGGSWYSLANNCRSAYRHGNSQVSRNSYYGFRVVVPLL